MRRRRSGRGGRLLTVVVLGALVAGGAMAMRAWLTPQPTATAPGPSMEVASAAPLPAEATAGNTDLADTTPAAPAAPATVVADAGTREANWREAREATIRMQERLRAQELARKAQQTMQTDRVRCENGQRMRRVDNGWVQDGPC